MKQKHFSLGLLTSLMLLVSLFSSCADDIIDSGTGERIDLNSKGYTGTVYPSVFKTLPGISTRAVAHKSYLWDMATHKSGIYVQFVNGTLEQQEKIMEYAHEWEEHTCIRFLQTNMNPDIRIKIANPANPADDAISWSFLGSENLEVAMDGDISMNLALKTGEEESDAFKAAVLMQFGHALGLIYEYQRPTAQLNNSGIDIDTDLFQQIIEDHEGGDSNYGIWEIEPNSLSDRYLIKTAKDQDGNTINLDWAFDAKSVMLPFFEENVICYEATGNKVIQKPNSNLSQADINYISAIYPPSQNIYQRGKTGKVHISIRANNWPWDYAIAPWNFDTQKAGTTRIDATYPTIGVGEYEWTTRNIRLKYDANQDCHYLNLSAEYVDGKLGNNFRNGTTNEQKIMAFEELYGTWNTAIDGALSYRMTEEIVFTRKDDSSPAENVKFDLPDAAAIYQMIGQMPKQTSNYNKEFLNFVVGYPEKIENEDKGIPYIYNMSKLPSHGVYKNTAALNVSLLGEKETNSNPGKSHEYGWNQYFRWHMKEDGQTRFGAGTQYGIHYNRVNYKCASVRYCRALTPKELGYELFRNTQKDIVEIVRYDQEPSKEANDAPIEKGVLRGLILSKLNKNGSTDVSKWELDYSLSELEKEARSIMSVIPF